MIAASSIPDAEAREELRARVVDLLDAIGSGDDRPIPECGRLLRFVKRSTPPLVLELEGELYLSPEGAMLCSC